MSTDTLARIDRRAAVLDARRRHKAASAPYRPRPKPAPADPDTFALSDGEEGDLEDFKVPDDLNERVALVTLAKRRKMRLCGTERLDTRELDAILPAPAPVSRAEYVADRTLCTKGHAHACL